MAFKNTDKNYGKTLLVALGCAVVSVLLCGMLLTTFMVSGSLDIGRMDAGAVVILGLSSLLGAIYIKTKMKEGRGVVNIIYVASLVMLLLISNFVIAGATFHSVLLKLIVIILGSAISLLGEKGKSRKYKRRKKR